MIKHIYWFAPYNLTCPSTRYRGKYPLEFFKTEYGISSEFIYPRKSFDFLGRFLIMYVKVLLFRKKGSIIVIQKICTNRFYAFFLKILVKIRKKNTIYDYDDAEQYRTKYYTHKFFIKNCEKVFVGSEFLYSYCKSINNNVFLLTSPIVPHNNIKETRNKIPSFGWVGDFGNGNLISKPFSHKTSLFNLFFPALLNIDYKIKVILIGIKQKSDIIEIIKYFENHNNIDVHILENLNWENDYWIYKEISKFDFGISALINHPFNIAKSAFKSKQYLSCGVPVIASNVGENLNFIKEGINGYICSNVDEFNRKIIEAINISDYEYNILSNNSLANIEKFSLKNYCNLFLENI